VLCFEVDLGDGAKKMLGEIPCKELDSDMSANTHSLLNLLLLPAVCLTKPLKARSCSRITYGPKSGLKQADVFFHNEIHLGASVKQLILHLTVSKSN
jgi:hypothetical protein